MTIGRLPAFGVSAGLHLVMMLVLLSLTPAASRASADDLASRAIAAFVVPPEDATFPGLNPLDAAADDLALGIDRESSSLALGSFTFDVAKIAEHAQVLFPFVSPGLSLEHFALAPTRDVHRTFDPLAASGAERRPAASDRPLALGDQAMQTLVDKSWSRRDRWSAFQPIAKLADSYSASAGRVPALLQQYVRQNWLQPYADAKLRDPRFWAELGLAADHVSFVGFVRRYASEHPSAKATIELLFLLDKMAQASRDALVTLVHTDPAEHLGWTRDANRGAYDLAAALRRYYDGQLARRGLESDSAIDAHYDAVRLAILNGILRTTPQGYRASDARFLIGGIYWKQRNVREAIRWWREMTIDPDDSYAIAASAILDALRSAGAQSDLAAAPIEKTLTARIAKALDDERGRWLLFSHDRLSQFGYHFDTY
jgi:hypothetical protein